MQNVQHLVRRLIRERGTSLKAASLAMRQNDTYLSQWLRKGIPAKGFPEESRRLLAEHLGCRESDLKWSSSRSAPPAKGVDMTNPRSATPPEGVSLSPFGTLPLDVPVFAARRTVGGGFAMSTETVIDFVRRHPGIATTRDVYAFRVCEPSMAPRHRPGDLLYVAPHWPPSEGDDVLIDLGDRIVLRELVAVECDGYTTRSLTPDEAHRHATGDVKAIHKILTLNDLSG